MQPEPNATNNYFNQLQMYQKFCKSDGKILTQSALSWYIWYEHFNTSNAVISLTEKVSELTSKSANKQEGRSGGFLFVFRYQQCSCFDSKHKMFTQEKESKVQTRPERLRQLKVSWKETKEQNSYRGCFWKPACSLDILQPVMVSGLCLKAFQHRSQSLGLEGWRAALNTFRCLSCNRETSERI